MSSILLHTCCAPCTTYVLKTLRDQGFEVTGYFYNPNVKPREEYERRLETMRYYAEIVGLKLLTPSAPMGSGHLPLGKGENERGLKPKDCENCYRVRLLKTAKSAKRQGFEYFSTTLLISPYQKVELMKKIGDEIAGNFGVKFFWQDFRGGYQESRKMARTLKLYMQKYCGCLT